MCYFWNVQPIGKKTVEDKISHLKTSDDVIVEIKSFVDKIVQVFHSFSIAKSNQFEGMKETQFEKAKPLNGYINLSIHSSFRA